MAEGATLHGFAVTGDADKIDDLLDRDLNEPALGEVEYRCASDTVFFTFADIPKLTSVNKPDHDYGYVAEKELSIWCLAADVAAGVPRLVWYLPYVFTDSGEAIATGREVYGYPKQLATVTLGAAAWSADAWVIANHNPNSNATQQRIIAVTHAAGAPPNLFPGRPPNNFGQLELVDNLVRKPLRIKKQIAPGGAPKVSATLTGAATPAPAAASAGGGWLRAPLTQVFDLEVEKLPAMLAMAMNPTLVFLKQFRDVECPTKACYQAIVEARLKVDIALADADAFQLLEPAGFAVEVHSFASHPIEDELGIGAAPVCTAAFQASLNFEIQTGFEVWRAPA